MKYSLAGSRLWYLQKKLKELIWISSLMPDQNYYDKDTGIRLTTFSKRNIKKELKSLVSKGVDINTITWENFNGR
jgi:hypothetical protein